MAKESLQNRAKKIKLTPQARGGYKGSDGKLYTVSEGAQLIMQGRANVAEWHSGKKTDKVSFEGTQYTGGRQTGRKNLVKLDENTFQNQYGVVFSAEERKALESAVNTANRKRKQMLEKEGKLPRLNAGKETGDDVRSLQLLGKESDFILARKSKSMQQFKSREAFESYLENVRRVSKPEYLEERTRLYKRNHMQALENVFGDDAKDVIMKIRMMKPEDYRELIQKDEIMEVSYIYDPMQASAKLNQIRAALNMKQKEDYITDV